MECFGIRLVICTSRQNALKEIGESARRSKLKTLTLFIQPIPPSYAGTVEKAKEWLQCVEVGGKNLIQSQEDSQLQTLYLETSLLYAQVWHRHCMWNKYIKHLKQQQQQSTQQDKRKDYLTLGLPYSCLITTNKSHSVINNNKINTSHSVVFVMLSLFESASVSLCCEIIVYISEIVEVALE